MKIICPQCNKKGRHETTSASTIEHLYSRLSDKKVVCWIEIRCDKCRYLADSWEAPEGYQKKKNTDEIIQEEIDALDWEGIEAIEEFYNDLIVKGQKKGEIACT